LEIGVAGPLQDRAIREFSICRMVDNPGTCRYGYVKLESPLQHSQKVPTLGKFNVACLSDRYALPP
jgi:hypothetical protein